LQAAATSGKGVATGLAVDAALGKTGHADGRPVQERGHGTVVEDRRGAGFGTAAAQGALAFGKAQLRELLVQL
jgi:hypothetical protein